MRIKDTKNPYMYVSYLKREKMDRKELQEKRKKKNINTYTV